MGLWALVNSSIPHVATSTDGINFANHNPGLSASSNFFVAYGNGKWLIGTNNSGIVGTSPDGVTWTSRNLSTPGCALCGVWANGQWVLGGQNGQIWTSPDGVTWTSRSNSFNSGYQVNGMAYGAGLWVATGQGGTILTSPDGVTWTSRSNPFGTGQITTAVYANGQFMVSGTGGNLMTSSDGVTWTYQGNAYGAFGNVQIRALVYGAAKWVAGGSNGNIATSVDGGVTWVNRVSTIGYIASMAYGGGLFVAAGSSSGGVDDFQTSPDVVTWTDRGDVAGAGYGNYTGIAYYAPSFVPAWARGSNQLVGSSLYL